MKSTDTIRDFYGNIIGYVDTEDKEGNKTARDFYKKILGRYDKKLNVTRDFYGNILTRGDTTAALIWQEEAKRQQKLSQQRQNKEKK